MRSSTVFAQKKFRDLSVAAQAWLDEDWEMVSSLLGAKLEHLFGSRILLTGAAGFLGFNFLNYFSYINRTKALGRRQRRLRVVAVDNFLRGYPRWLANLAHNDPSIEIQSRDIVAPLTGRTTKYDYIIHAASVASPTYYRKYPLQTLDANVTGLRNMLNLAHRTHASSMLFFSSSEIYGDPLPEHIPTSESYRGNVSCIGPRACYDESKRLGETLCYIYADKYHVPINIVRPFNNYGPGLRLHDKRVLPDFFKDALAGHDITIYSDGSPTRTFCYSSDALTGYLLALLSEHHGEVFNIGTEHPEISMKDLGHLVAKTAGGNVSVNCRASSEAAYLTDNPQRRCPDISKARRMLGYEPQVRLEEGLQRLFHWYRHFLPLEKNLDKQRPRPRKLTRDRKSVV